MFECTSRECSRESGDLLPHDFPSREGTQNSQSSGHPRAFSVVKRVEHLSEQFNSLNFRLLRIEQKATDSCFQPISAIDQKSFDSLKDLKDRLDKFECEHKSHVEVLMSQTACVLRLSEDLHALKTPRQAKTSRTSPLHTPRIVSLETQAREQSRKLEHVSLKLSELGNKSDDVFESELDSFVGPLKEELAALKEHVSQIPAGPSEKEFAALQDCVSQISVLLKTKSYVEDQELRKASSIDDSVMQSPDVLGHRLAEHECQQKTTFTEIDKVGAFSSPRVSISTSTQGSWETKTYIGRERLEYQWRESVWDVSILIGTEQMTNSSSLAAGMCLLFYLLLVGLLVSESSKAISQSSFDAHSRAELSVWRSTVAHHVNLRNPVTGESLASGVCNQRLYLPFANLQLDMVQVLSEYLEPHPFFSIGTGKVMCILVLFVWSIRLIHELALTLDVVSALVALPISPCTTFKEHMRDQSAVKLVSLSKVRVIFSMTLQLCRIFVAIVVGWSGSVFLVQETSLTDMLLNAVAMEFILDLDELIFCALFPKKARSFFEKIEPLKYEQHQVWAWQRSGYIMLVLGLGVLINFLALDPFVIELHEHLDALCGGIDNSSFDFVIAVDSLGMPWAAATSRLDTMNTFYAQHAVSQAKEFGFPRIETQLRPNERTNLGPFMQVSSPLALEKYMMSETHFGDPTQWAIIDVEDMDDVIGWDEALVLGGTDFGDAHGTVYNRYLQFLLGVLWNVNCSHVPFLRCHRGGLVFKKLCPRRCGCDAPTNGTISNAWATTSVGFQGCPEWVTTTRSFVKTLGDLPCEDASRSVFIRWLQGVAPPRHADTVPLADQLLASFDSGGCAAVAKIKLGDSRSNSRICAESSLPAICPRSCGCDGNVSRTAAHAWRVEYCPQSCGKPLIVRCHTINVNHSVDTGGMGPYVGLPCIFPFIYKGTTYNKCTTFDWSGPWCAVTKRKGHMYQWGDCPPSC